MKITEVFKSIQGEGPRIGTPTTFVRLYGCNMQPKCDFCDTRYSWDEPRTLFPEPAFKEMTVEQLVDEIKDAGDVTFTGGEPTIWDEQVLATMKKFPATAFHLETNGLMLSRGKYESVVISPKPQNCNPTVLEDYLKGFNKVSLKFVYEPGKEKWWEPVVDRLGLSSNQVFIMPEGMTRQQQIERMPEVIEYCKERGYRFSPRLHVLAFNTERGV